MVSLKVLKVEKFEVQAENATKLDVTVELSEEGQVLEERKLNFPLDITKEDLKSELQKFIDTYNSDRALAAANAELDAAHAKADEVIAEFTGLELSTESTETVATPEAVEEVAPVEEVVPESENPVVAEEVATEEAPSEPVEPVEPGN